MGAAWVEGDLVFHPEHGKGTVIEICFANSRGRQPAPARLAPARLAPLGPAPLVSPKPRLGAVRHAPVGDLRSASSGSACSGRRAPVGMLRAQTVLLVRAARPTVCE